MVQALDSHLSISMGLRVALVTNIPRPYRQSLYERLSTQLSQTGGNIKVFYYSDPERHIRRQGSLACNGKYASASVAGPEIRLKYERVLSIPTGLIPALNTFRPDVVIAGSFGPPGYFAWIYTRKTGIPYIQWSGSIAARPNGNDRLMRIWQSFLARRARVCLTYGTSARDYLVDLGVPQTRVVVGVNTVDLTAFQGKKARPGRENPTVAPVQLGSALNLLCVGSFVPRKGHHQLLEALHQIQDQAGSIFLHLVGTGPDEANLKAQAKRLGLEERVQFWGAQPPEKVPFFYALADVFVFPSLYDVWGLVLNEAMACGLPVIASSLAGATRDLVIDGQNGLVVDPRQVPALADALRSLIGDPNLRARMGRAAAKTIQKKATLEHSVGAFMRAIQLALDSPAH